MPSEILYDSVTARYITILCQGYGLTPSDIGMGRSSNGGETLAGTIRQERVSAKSGKALAKKKLQVYFENILPDTLMFKWVDLDEREECCNVSCSYGKCKCLCRSDWKPNRFPSEARRQLIADGLFTISLPETLDRKAIEWPSRVLTYSGNKSKEEKAGANAIGDPKAASSGGQGEVKPQQIISRSRAKIEVSLSKAVYSGNQILGALLNSVKNSNNDYKIWERKFEDAVVGKSQMDLVSKSVLDDTYNEMASILEKSEWLDTVSVEITRSAYDEWTKSCIRKSFIRKRERKNYSLPERQTALSQMS